MLSIIDGLGNNEVSIVVFMGDGPVVEEIRRRGLRAHVLPASRRGGLFSAAFRVRRALRGEEGQVLHANGMRAAIVAGAATLGTRWRVVWMKVDFSRDGFVARTVGHLCARVVGMSHAVNETFRGKMRRRIRVVYPGLKPPEIKTAAARDLVLRSLDAARDASVVVNAGRLTPAKGQLDLIEAAPIMLAEYPALRLALLGGDLWPWNGYREVLRDRAQQLGVEPAVSFLGHQAHEEVMQFVAGSDVLAAPSRHEPESGWKEGFGYSPVEAMSVGVPVVAYRHGAFPEVLGEAAVFVEEGDVKGLAHAILSVLRDSALRKRLIQKGEENAGRFRTDQMVAGMKRVYRELQG
jgi:glycosyltransferase involved in cell wall biosynthesis